MRAPVVEIADIFGQDPLQMALIEDEHVIQAVASHGPDPALGYGIGSRRSEWCANLGNTNIAHPTMECGAVTAVAIMNEKSWRFAIPGAAFEFAGPPMRRLDAGSHEHGELAGWRDG